MEATLSSLRIGVLEFIKRQKKSSVSMKSIREEVKRLDYTFKEEDFLTFIFLLVRTGFIRSVYSFSEFTFSITKDGLKIVGEK